MVESCPLVSNLRYVSRNEAVEAVSVVSFPLSRPLGYINEIQTAKFALLINRTSLIYLKVRLKALTSVIILYLIRLGIFSASWDYRLV